MIKTNEYITIIQEDSSGDFNVSFPDFPGCYTCGSTYEEAVTNAKEALALWIESLETLKIENNNFVNRPIITFTSLQLA